MKYYIIIITITVISISCKLKTPVEFCEKNVRQKFKYAAKNNLNKFDHKIIEYDQLFDLFASDSTIERSKMIDVEVNYAAYKNARYRDFVEASFINYKAIIKRYNLKKPYQISFKEKEIIKSGERFKIYKIIGSVNGVDAMIIEVFLFDDVFYFGQTRLIILAE
ncbi:MAG: hypothetical protein ACI9N1_000167 [Flavobacteriales bacterium]|jgi:hypothetical protein